MIKFQDYKTLDYKVFPSELNTIFVQDDPIYGGAHSYKVMGSEGFENGEAIYRSDHMVSINFVEKKNEDITYPGLQSEQLAYILLDRCIKLNNRFPSSHNEKMIKGLHLFLDACQERVQERIDRGVMGQLKK